MPVEELPSASMVVTLGFRLCFAVFDNIPPTALAIKQGGYDQYSRLRGWFSVAHGLVWLSAGVALSNM